MCVYLRKVLFYSAIKVDTLFWSAFPFGVWHTQSLLVKYCRTVPQKSLKARTNKKCAFELCYSRPAVAHVIPPFLPSRGEVCKFTLVALRPQSSVIYSLLPQPRTSNWKHQVFAAKGFHVCVCEGVYRVVCMGMSTCPITLTPPLATTQNWVSALCKKRHLVTCLSHRETGRRLCCWCESDRRLKLWTMFDISSTLLSFGFKRHMKGTLCELEQWHAGAFERLGLILMYLCCFAI